MLVRKKFRRYKIGDDEKKSLACNNYDISKCSLACGTTWHAASLLGAMKNNSVETKLASYGVELYRHLEEETGLGTSMCYILLIHTRDSTCHSCRNGISL